MPASLTIADVERIAALAHLELTAEEKEMFARQLADVLAYAEQVQQIDTSGVPATAHVLAAAGVEREDEPRPGLTAEEALANAPDAALLGGADDGDDSRPHGGLFRVPRVIGG